MALVFYYEDMLKKGNDSKNPAILSFFFVTERTHLNAAHALLVSKKIAIEWKIALWEIHLCLENH